MDETQGARVRWLVAGAFHPSPTGQRFLLTADALAEQLGRAARGLSVTVPDRIGAGDASAYDVSFPSVAAFRMDPVIDAAPPLRALRAVLDALSRGHSFGAEEAAHLQSVVSTGRLASALVGMFRGPRPPRDAQSAALAVLAEAVFGTARDVLQHPTVARLESSWRGLQWLMAHCPASAGMDIEVLDVGPEQLVDGLSRCLDVSPLQRPDACFILDVTDELGTLQKLAALGEQAWVPMVVALPAAFPTEAPEAWRRLRAEESSRWLCAALNRVVVMAEQQGPVRRECFTSPAFGLASLLSASFRDTRTFARLVGPGSGTRAPAVWRPKDGATLATEAGLALREQERFAAQGLVGLSGFWDSDAVAIAAAPTVYGGRDAVPLPAQLLTGRLVRLAQALADRVPAGAGDGAVSALFSRAADIFLSGGKPGACQIHGRRVSTGPGQSGVHVRASLRPELAGTHVQLELTVPLQG